MVARLAGRGAFGRGVLVLAGGAAGAQLINAASSPFLTRLFTPAEIGQLGLYLAFIYVATIGLSLRYEQAIVVPASDGDAARLATLAASLVPITSAACALVLVMLMLGGIGGFETLSGWIVPLGFVALTCTGSLAVVRYWLIRRHHYAEISRLSVTQSAARAVAQLAAGIAGLGAIGLVLGDLVGRLLGFVRPGIRAARDVRQVSATAAVSHSAVAGRYARYPLLGVPSSLVNAAAFSLPVPLLAAYYGLPVAGYFSLIQRVLGLPLMVVGQSVADALLGRIAEDARTQPERAMPLFHRTGAALLALGAVVAITVIVIGPTAFALVFGSEWRTAGTMAAIMAPWYAAALVVSPLSRVVLVYEGQGSKLIYDLLSLAVVVVAIAGGAVAGLDLFGTIGVLSAGQALAYAVYYVVLYRLVRRGSRHPRAGSGSSG
jgi:lipopolysaccharide exporter